MKLPEPPTLRALDRDDERECNLVLSGWMRSYTQARKGGAEAAHVPKNCAPGVEASVFYRLYEPVVKDLIARSTVLCAVSAAGFVYGWMAWEGEALHYVNVKPKWERMGIASWMLADFLGRPVVHTHRTFDWLKLCEGMGDGVKTWTYAPMRRFREAA